MLRFPAGTSHTTGDQGRGIVSGRFETCSTMSLSVNKDMDYLYLYVGSQDETSSVGIIGPGGLVWWRERGVINHASR